MISFPSIKHLAVWCVLLAVGYHLQGQNTFAQGKLKKVETAPIAVKLTASKTKVCLGEASVKLNLEITNISNHPVFIDKKQIWNGTITGDYREGKYFGSLSRGFATENPYGGDYFEIAPHKKYQDSYDFPFEDENLVNGKHFTRIGTYTLTYTYSPLGSSFGGYGEPKKYLYVKTTAAKPVKFQIIKCSTQNQNVSVQDKSNAERASPIAVKLTASKTKVCLGEASVKLNLEITNISNHPVFIDKKQIWNGTITGDYREGKYFGSLSRGFATENPYGGDYFEIAPHKKYQDSYDFPFEDENLGTTQFKQPGTYTLTYTYSPLGSSFGGYGEPKKYLYVKTTAAKPVKFQIVRCSATKCQKQ